MQKAYAAISEAVDGRVSDEELLAVLEDAGRTLDDSQQRVVQSLLDSKWVQHASIVSMQVALRHASRSSASTRTPAPTPFCCCCCCITCAGWMPTLQRRPRPRCSGVQQQPAADDEALGTTSAALTGTDVEAGSCPGPPCSSNW